MDVRSLRSTLRRLLVGPRRTALRVGIPVVVAAAIATAVSTALFLASTSRGGVYFPLDAAAIAVVASTLYAARYRAAVVCVAIGVASLAGSMIGFHVLHGQDPVLRTLVDFATDTEPVAIGAFFGVLGACAGGVIGYGYRVWRRRAA
ncbi:hypothetical protein [Halobacterium bonnevillei]|uniref:Uncharacterized protein n=1 Tax=Halobacterium bonnevillei TaxID=2692200 RepID=A0A6B0SJQ9_9EURY|nr:hypothetical protein [Halobacterium bonnevillei]MXR21938.1 hypothetical protein [Halobacterium bonnevillei]